MKIILVPKCGNIAGNERPLCLKKLRENISFVWSYYAVDIRAGN